MELQFPSLGLDRRRGYQRQPPYTTQDALNVRPDCVMEGRDRGGSRPGLGLSHWTQLGSGNPIWMLGMVSAVTTDNFRVWEYPFHLGELHPAVPFAAFEAGSHPDADDLPLWNTYEDGAATTLDTTDEQVAAVADDASLDGIDTAQAYVLEQFIVPYHGEHWGHYHFYCRMATRPPVCKTNGVAVDFHIRTVTTGTATIDATMDVYAATVKTTYTATQTSDTSCFAGWLQLLVSGNTLTLYWRGTAILTQAISAASGSRWGFGMKCTRDGGACLVDHLRAQYLTTAQEGVRNILYASANGSLYRESTGRVDTLTAVSSSATLATGHSLASVERGGKVYIADYALPCVTGTDGVVDATGLELSAAGVADWTALGISAYDHVVVITGGSAGVTNGTYAVGSVAAGALTLAATCGTTGTCSYRVWRTVKVYDPVAGTLANLVATAGTVPSGCPCIARYRDRLVLAGADSFPHVWYMSRLGTLTDWDTGASETDPRRAVGGGVSDAGDIGLPITALVAVSDDFMLFGCEHSIWQLRGDPAYGGQIGNLSRIIGIVQKGAWCTGPEGQIVFLSRDGLYMLPPGGNTYPQPLSRERLPEELLGINTATHTVVMAYDWLDQGVHIHVTENSKGDHSAWWFDWVRKGFWPVQIPNTFMPLSICQYHSTSPAASCVIFGCRDGYLRRYHPRFEHDDGTAISSRVDFGPLRFTNDPSRTSLTQKLAGTLGAESGSVTWGVYQADSGAGLKGASARETGTWAALRNGPDSVRVSGAHLKVRLSNSAKRAWAYETGTLDGIPGGLWRP